MVPAGGEHPGHPRDRPPHMRGQHTRRPAGLATSGRDDIASRLAAGDGQPAQLVPQPPQLERVGAADRAEQQSLGGVVVKVSRAEHGIQGGEQVGDRGLLGQRHVRAARPRPGHRR